MEDDRGYLRKVITKEHSVSRFITLNKLLSELHTLENCLAMGLVPKEYLAKHNLEMLEIQDCIERERKHIKSVSDLIDSNSTARAPVRQRYIRPRYKCIENLSSFEEKTPCAAEDMDYDSFDFVPFSAQERREYLPKKKPVKNDCDDELSLDGISGWGRMCEAEES